MIALNAHFDGKVIVPDEPVSLAPNQPLRVIIEQVQPGRTNEVTFSPDADLTAALTTGDTWGESAALHVDPLDAVSADFVRRPGSAAGQIQMAADFNDTPDDFEEYL